MWGRLDGAERTSLRALARQIEKVDLCGRTLLIKEANMAILEEELPPQSRPRTQRLMTDALVRASSGEPIVNCPSRESHEGEDNLAAREDKIEYGDEFSP